MDGLRTFTRIEPAKMFVSVTWKSSPSNSVCFRGKVLDISQSGMGIELYTKTLINFSLVNYVSITIEAETGDPIQTIENAEKKRIWSNDYSFGEENGIAVKFAQPLTEQDGKLVIGTTKSRRLDSQKEVAKMDIDHLSDYRRYLSECQMKVIEVCLTLGVALATLYFSLAFVNAVTPISQDSGALFWRTMIAGLGGLVGAGSALLFTQKCISLQRVDTYISLLKEWIIVGIFPREYKGWEVESRKLRTVLKSKKCDACRLVFDRKCGLPVPKESIRTKSLFRMNMPNSDFFSLLSYFLFLMMIALSILAIGYSLVAYQVRDIDKYVIVSVSITLFVTLLALVIVIQLAQFRNGKYSSLQLRRNWLDLMYRCQEKGY